MRNLQHHINKALNPSAALAIETITRILPCKATRTSTDAHTAVHTKNLTLKIVASTLAHMHIYRYVRHSTDELVREGQ